jgi:hypothetical protein
MAFSRHCLCNYQYLYPHAEYMLENRLGLTSILNDFLKKHYSIVIEDIGSENLEVS